MEKDIAASKEYFNKKVKYVTEQMEKVQVMLFNSGGSGTTSFTGSSIPGPSIPQNWPFSDHSIVITI